MENSPKSGKNWLTRVTPLRTAVGLVGMGLLAVALLPESGFAVQLARIGASIALIIGFLYGLTFWGKARVTIAG
jgi:hypothetical protein